MKHKISIIALIICGFWVLCGIVLSNNEDKTPKKVENAVPATVEENNKNEEISNEEKEIENTESIFKIGETAELNDVQVTMTDYKESAGGEWNKPSDGNVFVLAEFEIANNSDSEIAVSSVLSFEAYADDYALNYSFSALIDNDETQLDGTIAAGKKMKGWIAWEVPTDYKELEIHFTDNVWTDNKFIFLIEH